jgi:manganese transport protein
MLFLAVGNMDPGNWSVNLAGGSSSGYTLLVVVTLACLIAMYFQALALRLGIVTTKDLAQMCRDSFPKPVSIGLWITAEIAIAATDVAEVIGSAIALKLLFGLPLIAGVFITALDVLLILILQHRRFRIIELIVFLLIATITCCFIAELCLSKPSVDVLKYMFVPSASIFTDSDVLYIATGILGATIMPHNLYMHSSIAQTRAYARTTPGLREALRFATIDSTWALCLAFFVNASILILAADAFNRTGNTDVATLEDAYQLLSPLLGSGAASILFGVALLLSGQNSTLTGTMTGQIVMEGFLHWKIRPVYRRLLTRFLAIVPAVITVAIGGDAAVNNLLIGSQVVLSFQLGFAIFPLVYFTSSTKHMGVHFVNAWYTRIFGYIVACALTGLNLYLLGTVVSGA